MKLSAKRLCLTKNKDTEKKQYFTKIQKACEMTRKDLCSFKRVWEKTYQEKFPFRNNDLKGINILVCRDEENNIVGGTLISLWIHDLFVDPDYQSQGIGSKIVNSLKKRGNFILQVDNSEKNADLLHNFYGKNNLIKSDELYCSYEYRK